MSGLHWSNKAENTPSFTDTQHSNHSHMYLEIVLPLILNLPYNVIEARRKRVIEDWKRSLAKTKEQFH